MEPLEYAERRDIDAKGFAKAGVYARFIGKLKNYKRIIEVGCGTGESTLALLKEGHFVVAIDVNEACISMTREKLLTSGYKDKSDFILLSGNFYSPYIQKVIGCFGMDLIICWNPSAFINKNEARGMMKLLRYNGYTVEQLNSNFSSCYCEFLQISILNYAKNNSLAASLVDRGFSDEEILLYFDNLNAYFKFKNVEKDSIFLSNLSSGGIELSLRGKNPTKENNNGYLVFGLFSTSESR